MADHTISTNPTPQDTHHLHIPGWKREVDHRGKVYYVRPDGSFTYQGPSLPELLHSQYNEITSLREAVTELTNKVANLEHIVEMNHNIPHPEK